jgi:hypothetical protein
VPLFSMEYSGAHRRIWSPWGAQFGEEFGEVLFSILAVEEQISCHLFPATSSLLSKKGVGTTRTLSYAFWRDRRHVPMYRRLRMAASD